MYVTLVIHVRQASVVLRVAGKRESDACVMFVRNLSFEVTENMLWEFFPSAKSVRIPVDSSNKARG